MNSEPTSNHSTLPGERRAILAGLGGLAAGALLVGGRSAHAGPLDPPVGPVASTGKTLTEVEPRIAINAVNTPGDADSVFKITQPGSYYLTGNVTGPSGKSGIEIAASNVTIDLNGFALLGEAGSGSGIVATVAGNAVVVCNGNIRGWGSHGISLINFTETRVQRVIVINCLAYGFNLGGNSLVRDCLAASNGGNGFYVNGQGVIDSCEARGNAGDGIVLTAVGQVTRCVSRSNTLIGIRSSSNGFSLIADNIAVDNLSEGIRVSRACIVARNECAFNGVLGGAGIRVTGGDNRLEDNLCVNNTTTGISVDASGNIIVRNSCSGNGTNWNIVANNVYGPILDRSTPASAAVNGNAAASSLGTTDPHANFTF